MSNMSKIIVEDDMSNIVEGWKGYYFLNTATKIIAVKSETLFLFFIKKKQFV